MLLILLSHTYTFYFDLMVASFCLSACVRVTHISCPRLSCPHSLAKVGVAGALTRLHRRGQRAALEADVVQGADSVEHAQVDLGQ